MNQFKKAKLKAIESGQKTESINDLQTAGVKKQEPEFEKSKQNVSHSYNTADNTANSAENNVENNVKNNKADNSVNDSITPANMKNTTDAAPVLKEAAAETVKKAAQSENLSSDNNAENPVIHTDVNNRIPDNGVQIQNNDIQNKDIQNKDIQNNGILNNDILNSDILNDKNAVDRVLNNKILDNKALNNKASDNAVLDNPVQIGNGKRAESPTGFPDNSGNYNSQNISNIPYNNEYTPNGQRTDSFEASGYPDNTAHNEQNTAYVRESNPVYLNSGYEQNPYINNVTDGSADIYSQYNANIALSRDSQNVYYNQHNQPGEAVRSDVYVNQPHTNNSMIVSDNGHTYNVIPEQNIKQSKNTGKKNTPNIFSPKGEAKSMRKSLVLKPTSVKIAENYCAKNGGSFNELIQTLLDNFINEYGL